MTAIERDTMDVDVLFVGAGPASLAGALHLTRLYAEHNASGAPPVEPPEIMVLEKSAELGNHCLSGAVMNPVAWRELLGHDAPIPGGQPVTRDGFYLLSRRSRYRVWPLPPLLSNHGNVIVSVAELVRDLGARAEAAGVNVMTGFAAAELLFDGEQVSGVQTRDVGIDKQGAPRPNFEPGMVLRAGVTVLGEGTRGTLTRQLERRVGLPEGSDPQHYALGVKEVWRVDPARHRPGEVWHTLGWPLSARRQVGGGWIYHMADGLVSLGLVTRLDYDDPLLDPFEEFQRQKLHPWIAELLAGGKLIEYGAKSIPEGGWYSLPHLQVPGCLVVGDAAGLVNGFKLKGLHYAIKSGMLAAEAIFAARKAAAAGGADLSPLARYPQAVRSSYIGRELHHVRNFHSALGPNLPLTMLRVGTLIATGGRLLMGWRKRTADWRHMRPQRQSIVAREPEATRQLPRDNPLIFDRATALYHSDTQHEENQPAHLVVGDLDLCSNRCYQEYGSPCQRFCPAEVYQMEVDPTSGKAQLVLHPSNCVHCKTCDIKDPYENILWVVPEPGGGPRYKRT
jgi:electron-transferring-flavoprotein dehydrogenase